MDENRLKGAATDLGGKLKDAAGGLTGSPGTQAEGKADQLSGQLQNTYGSAKDTVREGAGTLGAQLTSFVQERPLTAVLATAAVAWMLSRFMRR